MAVFQISIILTSFISLTINHWKFQTLCVLHVKGDIFGATELQGPSNYKYSDLKAATKNFSHENKLGAGGFGDVYKVN